MRIGLESDEVNEIETVGIFTSARTAELYHLNIYRYCYNFRCIYSFDASDCPNLFICDPRDHYIDDDNRPGEQDPPGCGGTVQYNQ